MKRKKRKMREKNVARARKKKEERKTRDETAEKRKKEENCEKYRDSKNIAEEEERISNARARRGLSGWKRRRKKRGVAHGTRRTDLLALSDGARLAARGARSRVRTGPCTIQIYVYAARCTCINRTHA